MLNAHGGNVAACAIAVAEASRELGLVAATAMPSDLVDPDAVEGPVHGHAGSFETSLMLALDPDRVRPDLARPSPGGARATPLAGPRRRRARPLAGAGRLHRPPGRGVARARRAGARGLRRGRRRRVRAARRHRCLTCTGRRSRPSRRRRSPPARRPALKVRGARVVHDASTFTLVRVVTDEGVEGFGEVSATAAWSGEDAVTATHFVRDVLGSGARRQAARADRGARDRVRPHPARQLVHEGRRQHRALGRARAHARRHASPSCSAARTAARCR